jgi:hypothetical protein
MSASLCGSCADCDDFVNLLSGMKTVTPLATTDAASAANCAVTFSAAVSTLRTSTSADVSATATMAVFVSFDVLGIVPILSLFMPRDMAPAMPLGGA